MRGSRERKPKRKRSGWTAPGYNYMGPGNPMDNGPPVDTDDWASRWHDRAYKRYEDEQGIDPKKVWVPEDQKWLDEADWKGWSSLGKLWFGGKKVLGMLGAIPSSTLKNIDPIPPSKKRKERFTEPQRDNPYKRLRRNALFADDTWAQSLLNKQQNTQVASTTMDMRQGSGNNAGLKETPIDEIDRPVTRGPPEYTFASLPYVRDVKIAATQWARDIGFRMTSPYDPEITGAAIVDQNAGAGSVTTQTIEASDATDTTATSARWFDFYATLYNYYHVIGARWHCTIENHSNEPLWCHQLYCNDEVPPMGATNEDIMCWKNTESHLIGSHAVAITTSGRIEANHSNSNVNNVEGAGTAANNPNYETSNHVNSRGVGPILKLSGEYKPGQFRRQIHLDSEVENWTAVNANPSLPERVLFRFKPWWNAIDTNDGNTYDRTMVFNITFRIEYLVEFKELKTGLRWPVERQPVIAAIQANIEEDEE